MAGAQSLSQSFTLFLTNICHSENLAQELDKFQAGKQDVCFLVFGNGYITATMSKCHAIFKT